MIIVGAGGHAREVFNELRLDKQHVTAFYDEVNEHPLGIFGVPALSDFHKLPKSKFVLGVGKPELRKALYQRFIAYHDPASVISPTAQISTYHVELGEGLNVMHGVFIGPNVRIGSGTLINAKSSIHHDSRVGSFCEICLGVLIAGACTIGESVFIGMGAMVLPGIHIGDRAVIGAGAVVTKDVPADVTVKGIPAQ
ncbi:MAG: acetyltransferase [Bacteroidetes bacterium]|nr:acetyltransferase [Bacteroidota bacterium]MBM3424975.1 acetyltransferase [Bacteroidota bacterium]